ncbi:MAG: RIP metalloprotease RseP [Neisseria sp.]|nr:RIP metalloprotease RseP [Neisseria sp.]
MLTLPAFIAAILILVGLHEFGHYLAARLCGIKVLRFSIGMGKPFYSKKRGDTEWCLAPIPLGGYVKMVDTREGEVSEADLPYAFDKQHPAKKIAVVAAGPLTNLALAVLLYGLSFSFGVTELKPYIGTVEPGSIAAHAGFRDGDRVNSVNGKPVANWSDLQTGIVLDLEAGSVNVDVTTAEGENAVRRINIAGTREAAAVPLKRGYIGLMPYRLTNTVAAVEPDSPAAAAGLKKGDTILAADGKKITNAFEWVELVKNNPGQKIQLTYSRDGKIRTVAVRPDSETQPDGTLTGKIGLATSTDRVWDEKIRHRYRPTLPQAFKMGWDKTADYTVLTLKFFGRLLTGQASVRHVSGPITIAEAAGKSALLGWQPYLEFLALISLSLGVMNFLPIPVLDGGHLVFYTAEWLRGRPLGERAQNISLRIGVALMLMLMLLAFFNDITRLLA